MLITKVYSPKELPQAAKELQLGELIAFPTETVYGLGADATNAPAVKRVYLAKGRPSDNPLIVTVGNPAMIKPYVKTIPATAQALIDHFWPGPLTIILPIKPNSLPDAVTGGLTTAAFRLPNNHTTQQLINLVGKPLVGPSANSSGKPSPTTAQHVYHDLVGRIAGIVDDGPTTIGVESTILDLSVATPTILRPGAVTPEQIEAIIHQPVIADHHHVGKNEVPKAPGMKYKHYAPSAQVLMVAKNDWQKALDWAQKRSDVGILAPTTLALPPHFTHELTYPLGENVNDFSANLFAGLRYFDDDEKIKFILAPKTDFEGLGAAYMNRLQKAAGNTSFAENTLPE